MGGQQSDMSEALNQKQTERSRSMKLTQGVFASVLCLGLSVQAFAGSFEGVVTMKETSDGEATLKKTYFKGDKMREDHSEGGYMVWDAAKKEGLIVDAKKRTVIVMPWPEVKSADARQMFEGTTVTKTGKSDKVSGYSCEIYLSKDQEDNSSSELCVAKGIGNAAMLGIMGGGISGLGGYPAWFRDLVKDGGFPLRHIDRDESGKVESRGEATVEAKRLDESLFAAPVGYTSTDRATTLKQLGEEMRKRPSRYGC